MSRYVDKDGNYVICSRADYIKEMERRQAVIDKAAKAKVGKAAKGGK